MIIINIEKAKEVHKNILREVRKKVMEKLDVEYMRASEQGLDTTEIVAKKQELRDVTNHPDLLAAKTVNELKAVWPAVLGEKPDFLK